MTHHHAKHEPTEHPHKAHTEKTSQKQEAVSPETVALTDKAESTAIPPDTPDTSDGLVEKLTAELALRQEEYLRAKAETENVRRRAVEERIKVQKFAVEGFAADLLPVVDGLLASLDNKTANTDKVLEGVEMTHRMLISALEKNAIKEIPSMGEKFDPALHQAIGMEETEGEAGRVIRVLQTGYRIHERVLRPAMVMVSKNKV